MTIAEQLIQARADLDEVYEAGKKAGGGGGGIDYFQIITKVEGLFIRATFPKSLNEVTLTIPNCLTSLTEFIRQTTGLTKITLNIPTDQSYKATYFAYRNTDIVEITFHENIKFTDLTNFVSQASALVKINGTMDLSDSTNNATGFTSCPALKEVRFKEGSIKKSISFNSSANLSANSIASIIEGLSLEVSGQTLTVHKDVAAQITETDVTDRGWTLAY
jgi:hypothetical protein